MNIIEDIGDKPWKLEAPVSAEAGGKGPAAGGTGYKCPNVASSGVEQRAPGMRGNIQEDWNQVIVDQSEAAMEVRGKIKIICF